MRIYPLSANFKHFQFMKKLQQLSQLILFLLIFIPPLVYNFCLNRLLDQLIEEKNGNDSITNTDPDSFHLDYLFQNIYLLIRWRFGFTEWI